MVKIKGIENKVEIKALNNKDLLSYVESSKDQSAFSVLFDRLESQVRNEIYSLGSDIRIVRKMNGSA